MPPKKNNTKSSPRRNTVEMRSKKKEKPKLKIPSIIKFKLPSTRCLQNPSSQSIPAELSETKQPGKLAANEENPDSQSNLTSLKAKSIPVRVTKALKRKRDTDTHELTSTEYTDSQIVNLPPSKAKSPAKSAKKANKLKDGENFKEYTDSEIVNRPTSKTKSPAKSAKKAKKLKEGENFEVNPVIESPVSSTLKAKIIPTRVLKSRRKKFDAKEHVANDLTNGDIQSVTPATSTTRMTKKPKLTRAGTAKQVNSTADDYKCNLRTAVVLLKQSKTEKRLYDARERKIELANEVALAQLGCNPAFQEAPPPPLPQKAVKVQKPIVTKRRGRRPKNQEAEETANQPSTTDPAKESIKTTPKKKAPKKVAAKHDKIEVNGTMTTATSKMKADSTSKKSTKKQKTNQPEKLIEPKLKRKYTRRKGKEVNDITSTDLLSPSILESLRSRGMETIEEPMSLRAASSVTSRKTFLTNASDDLYWTKDISDSSTTTCVTVRSNDFVRIDKKLPVLKLLNCSNALKCKPVSDSETTDETTKRTSLSSSDTNSISHSLNLSSSSTEDTSPDKSHATSAQEVSNESVTGKNDDISKIGYELDKITSQLMKIDQEVINWLGPENEDTDANIKLFEENVFNVLPKEEKELLMICREVNRIFGDGDDSNLNLNNEISPVKCVSEENLVKMDCLDTVCDATSDSPEEKEDGEITSDSSESDLDSYEDKDNAKLLFPRADEASRRLEQVQFDNDDDALSLFAESITEMESLREDASPVRTMCKEPVIRDGAHEPVETNVPKPCVPQPVEAYIPQPISHNPHLLPTPKITYRPTKIIEDSDQGAKASTVCEKQNADSTSIYRETEHSKEPVVTGNVENEAAGYTPDLYPSELLPVANKNQVPILIADVVPQITTYRSNVFKGICFLNLKNNCTRVKCRYPHTELPIHEVRSRLFRLSDEGFMQEYLLLRSWTNLRRLYRMCFVEQCRHRGLTRVLVEMALDSIRMENKSLTEDAIFKVQTIDMALLHLNEHFHKCHDLLNFKVHQKILCNIFMETIAETQNFSRFKSVFVKLTYFIASNIGGFTLKVANQILERVCILPFEMPLALALLTIVRNTDASILGNSMMGEFEKQLSCAHDDLHKEFVAYKQQALVNRPDLDECSLAPRVPNDVPPNREMCPPLAAHPDKGHYTPPVVQSERERYTSPDTTKLDNMNKVVSEPVVTRTMQRVLPTPPQSFISNSSISSGNTDFRPPIKAKFRRWRPYNNVNNGGMRFPRPIMRPLMGPPMMRRPYLNHRQVTYRPPPNFPRMHGPDNM